MLGIILLGPPGAGKGTQAQAICQCCGVPQISTGDILRSAVSSRTSIGKEVHGIMQKGELVPDSIILDLIKERVSQADCHKGFLLDGFPRNLEQAQAMEQEAIEVDFIIELVISDNIVIERLSGRRVHLNSGRVYHTVYNPPAKENIDDVSGEPLVHRSDDLPETIRKRLEVYHRQTEPLVEYYRTLADKNEKYTFSRIKAEQPIQQVTQDIIELLSD